MEVDLTSEELNNLTSLKNINISSLEAQQTALQMVKDGFSTEQIAEALGYSVNVINNFTQMTVDIGSPEDILRESLRTVTSLIPIADAQYREKPSTGYAYTLTAFIESARSLIAQAYTLKTKEDTYKSIIAKVLQPLCRDMIKAMLGEVNLLRSNTGTKLNNEDLKTFSTNLGKKFQECYRKSTEDLSLVLGVSSNVKTKILSSQDDGLD